MKADFDSVERKLLESFLLDYSSIRLVFDQARVNKAPIKNQAFSKLQLWMLSTRHRESFVYCMFQATLVRQPYTIKEICDAIQVSRQSATQMTNDCLIEGWITRSSEETDDYNEKTSENGEPKKYYANQVLMDFGLTFIDRYIEQIGMRNCHETITKLHEIRMLREIALDPLADVKGGRLTAST